MPIKPKILCACGCLMGARTDISEPYARGHNPKSKLCACGCGKRLRSDSKLNYVYNHKKCLICGSPCGRNAPSGETIYCSSTCHGVARKGLNWDKRKRTCVICDDVFYIQRTQNLKRKTCSSKCLGSLHAELNKHKNNLMRNKGKSKLEDRVAEILTPLGFQRHININKYTVDFCRPKTKEVVEVFGDYWHANPAKYAPQDLILHGHGRLTSESIWARDAQRSQALRKQGFSIVILWEHDILSYPWKELLDLNFIH